MLDLRKISDELFDIKLRLQDITKYVDAKGLEMEDLNDKNWCRVLEVEEDMNISNEECDIAYANYDDTSKKVAYYWDLYDFLDNLTGTLDKASYELGLFDDEQPEDE